MTFMTIFAIMAVGLNIVVGFAGLLDLGYVAFYAIGAYVAAFLASPHFGRPWGSTSRSWATSGRARRGSTSRSGWWSRGGHRRRDGRGPARRTDAAIARRLPRDRDPWLRRDRPARLQEPVEPDHLVHPRSDRHRARQRQRDGRRAGHQSDRSALPALLQPRVRLALRAPCRLSRRLPAGDRGASSPATSSTHASAARGWRSARTRRRPR